MSVCVFVCPSHFLTTFFAPPSRSPKSKKFRFLESLGKSNGAKWSQLSIFLLIKGVKLLRQNKIYVFFFHLFTLFNGIFAPTHRSPMSELFGFSKFWGKSSGKKWSQIWKPFFIKRVKFRTFFLFFYFALPAWFFDIGCTIGIGQEILCLPYSGFFGASLKKRKKFKSTT